MLGYAFADRHSGSNATEVRNARIDAWRTFDMNIIIDNGMNVSTAVDMLQSYYYTILLWSFECRNRHVDQALSYQILLKKPKGVETAVLLISLPAQSYNISECVSHSVSPTQNARLRAIVSKENARVLRYRCRLPQLRSTSRYH